MLYYSEGVLNHKKKHFQYLVYKMEKEKDIID